MNRELQKFMEAKNREVIPRILMTGAECAPFAKTGGLADVIGTLTREIDLLGFDIRLMLPFHRVVKDQYRDSVRHVVSFSVDIGGHSQYVGIEFYDWDGVPVYFIDNEHYFGHAIYCGGHFEGEQYAYFSRAVIEALPLIDFDPDVIHVNDWHTAMIPMLIKPSTICIHRGDAERFFRSITWVIRDASILVTRLICWVSRAVITIRITSNFTAGRIF